MDVFPIVHTEQRHLYKHFKISEEAKDKTSKHSQRPWQKKKKIDG